MTEHAENIAGEGVANQVGSPPDSPPAGTPTPTFDAILAAVDLADDYPVDVDEWGMRLRVRGISRGEYRRILKTCEVNGIVDEDQVDIHLLATAVVEPSLTFEQANELFEKKSITSIGTITRAILEASGLGAGFRT